MKRHFPFHSLVIAYAMPCAFQMLRQFGSPQSAKFTNTFSELLRVLQNMAADVATQSLAIAEGNQNASKRVWEKVRTRGKIASRFLPRKFSIDQGKILAFQKRLLRRSKAEEIIGMKQNSSPFGLLIKGEFHDRHRSWHSRGNHATGRNGGANSADHGIGPGTTG